MPTPEGSKAPDRWTDEERGKLLACAAILDTRGRKDLADWLQSLAPKREGES